MVLLMATTSQTPLEAFSSQLRKSNVSRPYLFYLDMTVPPGLMTKDSSTEEARTLSLFCAGAQTPMLQMFTNDNYYEAGIKRKYVNDYDYQDFILDFYVDQDYTVQKFFAKWKELIVSSRRNFNYPDEYTAENFDLHLIDLKGESKFMYSYKRVVPKTFNSVSMQHGSHGVIVLSVSFVFETVSTTSDTAKSDLAETNVIEKIKNNYSNPEVYQGLQSNLNRQSIISGLGGDFGGAGGTGSW